MFSIRHAAFLDSIILSVLSLLKRHLLLIPFSCYSRPPAIDEHVRVHPLLTRVLSLLNQILSLLIHRFCYSPVIHASFRYSLADSVTHTALALVTRASFNYSDSVTHTALSPVYSRVLPGHAQDQGRQNTGGDQLVQRRPGRGEQKTGLFGADQLAPLVLALQPFHYVVLRVRYVLFAAVFVFVFLCVFFFRAFFFFFVFFFLVFFFFSVFIFLVLFVFVFLRSV